MTPPTPTGGAAFQAAPVGPIERRLLGLRDSKLRRCWWCGEWAWHHDPCLICTAPAARPHDFNKEDSA